MNWLDWIIVAAIFWSGLRGFWSGLVLSLTRFTGIIVGLAVSTSYYKPLAKYLTLNWHLEDRFLPLLEKWLAGQDLAQRELIKFNDFLAGSIACGILEVVSFLVLFMTTGFLFSITGLVLTKMTNIAFLGPLNKLGGLFFGVIKGLLMIVIILTFLSYFQQQNLFPDWKSGPLGSTGPLGTAFRESMLLPYFEPYLTMIGQLLPEILKNKSLPGSIISI